MMRVYTVAETQGVGAVAFEQGGAEPSPTFNMILMSY